MRPCGDVRGSFSCPVAEGVEIDEKLTKSEAITNFTAW